MRLCSAALAVALAACWQPPHAPDGSVAIPGALWTTPTKPWRFPRYLSNVVPDGTTAMAVLSTREVARIDLATGRIVASRKLPDYEIKTLTHLADGRWLVTGDVHGGFAGATLDPTTLAPTPLPVRGHPTAASIRHAAGQLADGRVVLSGNGIAFAAYDPHTWTHGPAIAPLTSEQILVEPDAVVVTQALVVTRYSMAGGASTTLPAFVGSVVADTHGVIAQRRWTGEWSGQIRRADGTSLILQGPTDGLALSSDGTRAAVLGGGHLRVVRIADDHELASFELGDGARAWADVVLDGERVIVAIGTQLRVVDLATKSVTPDGGPPYAVRDVAVADDGQLLAIGGRAWSFASTGAMTQGVDLYPHRNLPPPLGEVTRVAELDTQAPSDVKIVDAATGAVQRTIGQGSMDDAWIAASGELVASVTSTPSSLWRGVHGELERALYYTDQTVVSDVDADADTALLASGGDAHLVRLRDATKTFALPMPACDSYASAMLERHGRRVYTMSDEDIYVWDRVTGDLIASLHQPPAEGTALAAFVPDHDELIVQHGSQLSLWSTRDQQLRTLEPGAELTFGVSPDGKRLGLVLGDGRTSLVDLDVVRASVVPRAASEAKEPPSCAGTDPIAEPPPEPEPPLQPDEGQYGP